MIPSDLIRMVKRRSKILAVIACCLVVGQLLFFFRLYWTSITGILALSDLAKIENPKYSGLTSKEIEQQLLTFSFLVQQLNHGGSSNSNNNKKKSSNVGNNKSDNSFLNSRSQQLSYIIEKIHRLADMNSAEWPFIFVNGVLKNAYKEYNVSITKKELHKIVRYYPALNQADARILRRTLFAFYVAVNSAMEPDKLTYFLHSGTLLGSYRHHDRIPWDDDIDVIFNTSKKNAVKVALSALYPVYRVLSYQYRRQWKFYYQNGHIVKNFPHRSPYVDIFFFTENATHIWNEQYKQFPLECCPKAEIFPLRPRPFGSLILPTPCDTRAAIKRFYKGRCQLPSFDHLKDIHIIYTEMECVELQYLFPFVHHTPEQWTNFSDRSFETETLMFNNVTIDKFSAETYC